MLVASLALLLSGCRSTQSVTNESQAASSFIQRDTIYTTSYRDRIVVDTLHDSVYIRQVINAEGKTVYVEKNTSRDHKAQTVIKHDTVFVRASATARADSTSVVRQTSTSSGVRVGMQEFLFLVCLVGVYVLALVGLYFYNKTGK